jgi:hypothetical protein
MRAFPGLPHRPDVAIAGGATLLLRVLADDVDHGQLPRARRRLELGVGMPATADLHRGNPERHKPPQRHAVTENGLQDHEMDRNRLGSLRRVAPGMLGGVCIDQ